MFSFQKTGLQTRSVKQMADSLEDAGLNQFTKLVQQQLRVVGKGLVAIASKKFGVYQPQIGNYPGWAKLSPGTVKQKQKRGASGDEPLIGYYSSKGTGKVFEKHLKDSIEFKVEKFIVRVGTKNPLGEKHEYGSGKVPPRPFLRPAMFEGRKLMQDAMKVAVAKMIDKL